MISHMFLLFHLLIGSAFADLQNSDFETPPSNLVANSTSPFSQLNETSSVFPGWSFQGTVFYVATNKTASLPGNGHAIQLAQDGKINQTFFPSADFLHYLLTFTISPGGQSCSDNATIAISAPDSHAVFSFKQNYGKERWESYGVYLGTWEQQEPINLVIESQATASDTNSTCWPLIDTLLLKSLEAVAPVNNNLLLNGGFEFGPEFVVNSTEGVLLDEAPSPVLSALRQWAIMGTVKYIDSQHYFIPEGKAAIEIVSGVSAGIQAAITLTVGSTYRLEFTLGDANDSCEGHFSVGAQAGSTAQNFSLQSNGTGSAANFSLPFKAESMTVSISFISYTTTQTKDGVFCGPVVDNVILRASYGKTEIKWKVLIPLLFLVAII